MSRVVGIHVDIPLDVAHSLIWMDVGGLFKELALQLPNEKVQTILKGHPYGAKLIEAIPE